MNILIGFLAGGVLALIGMTGCLAGGMVVVSGIILYDLMRNK